MIGTILTMICAGPAFANWSPAPGMGHAVGGPTEVISPLNTTTYKEWTTTSWDKDTYLVNEPSEVQVR